MRPLSFTQVSLYQSCPLCYKLQYIDGLKTKAKSYFSFGSSLHGCAEYFFRVRTPPPPSLDDLLRFYELTWVRDGYESAEEEGRFKAYGREILAGFWHAHNQAFRMPVAVEKQFNIDIQGVKLTGFIDRVDKLDSGGLEIIDYKSGKELFTADYLANDLQLTLYQEAAEKIWGLPVERLTLYHLRTNTPCRGACRGPQALAAARELVVRVAENIAAARFPAIEGPFCPCDFPERCPYYRHRYQKAIRAPRQERLPGFAAAEAVEAYASLQAEIRDLRVKLDECRQGIVDFCRQQGLKRVFGTDHAVTCDLVEKAEFDEAAVKPLLESAGLWEEVRSLDQAKLKSLINDGLDADLSKRFDELRQVTSYYQLRVRKLEKEA